MFKRLITPGLVAALALAGCKKSNDEDATDLGMESSSGDENVGAEPIEAEAPPENPDKDGDGFANDVDKCPDEAETWNSYNDHDGCPDSVTLVWVDDRIVVDEKVFFETDSSKISKSGIEKLKEMAQLYKTEKDWATLHIEGHADKRGTEPYNEELSKKRAEAVKRKLVNLGVPKKVIDTNAYGENKPLVQNANTPRSTRSTDGLRFVLSARAPTTRAA